MNEGIDKSCEGCIVLEDSGQCYMINLGREKDCPCRICLIKVMCNTTCKEYDEYKCE